MEKPSKNNQKKYSFFLALNITILILFIYLIIPSSNQAIIFMLIILAINYFIVLKVHKLYNPIKIYKDYPTKGMIYSNYITSFILIFSLILAHLFKSVIYDHTHDPLLFFIIVEGILAVVVFLTMIIAITTIDYLNYKKLNKISVIDIFIQAFFTYIILFGIAIFVSFVIGMGIGLSLF